MFSRTSIRGKIALGYGLSFVFLLFVASVLFVNLIVVEDWLVIYERVARFFDTTLEMRRYEKNYLLYGQSEDLVAATKYADEAKAGAAALGGETERWYRGWFALLAGVTNPPPPEVSPDRIARLLAQYRDLLEVAGRRGAGGEAEAPDHRALVAAIRDHGRTITEYAEQVSAVEGAFAQTMLRAGRRALLLLVALFLIGSAATTHLVLQNAILPLKDLEEGMHRIAKGELELLPQSGGTDELDSMHEAFNRMITEILTHRRGRIHSDRLAALGTMLAGIAHELNNPLANISTSTEILMEEHAQMSDAERGELIAQVLSQTDRATGIIRTVLDFSREPTTEHRATDLLSAVKGSLILVRGKLPADVTVEVDVPPDIQVDADKTMLEQAFINVMSNAIDAMAGVARDHRLSIAARPAGAEAVEIAFGDTGSGIPPDLLDRVFDPFFSTKEAGRGTGLGLYITHQIIEQHKGTITVDSAVDRGTTVTLKLPARPAGTARESGPAS